jgi:hypothetical protein
MGKTKRRTVGTVNFNPDQYGRSRENDYANSRPQPTHKHRSENRTEKKIKEELFQSNTFSSN